MDKKHSFDDNDDNSSVLNESGDSNQYHHGTTSHNFEDPKSENSDDEGSDEGTEEEDEHDFWSLLTQETARKMHNDRLAADLPGPDETIQDVYQLVEGKKLSIVMNHLKNRYRDIKEISEAANLIHY